MFLYGDTARSIARLPLRQCALLAIIFCAVPRSVTTQCFNPPPNAIVESQVTSGDGVGQATIGMDAQGRYVIAFTKRLDANPPCGAGFVEGGGVAVIHYCMDGTAASGQIPITHPCQPGTFRFEHPTIALKPNGDALIGLVGTNDNSHTRHWPTVYFHSFGFGLPPFPGTIGFPEYNNPENYPTWNPAQSDTAPSAGASTNLWHGAWAHTDGSAVTIEGIPFDTTFEFDPQQLAKQCGISDLCWQFVYQPCMAMRPSDGYFAIAYAESEAPFEVPPAFNIAIRVFDSSGNLIANLNGPDRNSPSQWVNNPMLEDPSDLLDTDQVSPSVSFVGDNIVVTWLGPALAGQSTPSTRHVYARRFKFDQNAPPGQKLRDPNGTTEGRAGLITVDHDPNVLLDQDSSNAVVALTQATDQNAGKFFVAWNVQDPDVPYNHFEIRGQYFDAKGMLDGAEFRVNQDNSATEVDGVSRYRLLAESAQHTLAYSAAGTVVTTWNEGLNSDAVYFTMLPPGYAANVGCCKGDMMGDGDIDGDDTILFMTMILGGQLDPPHDYLVDFCHADMNADGILDTHYDILYYAETALSGTPCPNLGYIERAFDCNNNDVPDYEEIASDPNLDCNNNGFLDECDAELGPKWGATDCNNNGVPDECDIKFGYSPDCNQNGIPDSCDIASGHSPDRDHDGVPDECAILDYGPTMLNSLACEPAGDLDAAWLAFYQWSLQQCWGPNCPLTGAEQYQAIVNKKCELGLPIP